MRIRHPFWIKLIALLLSWLGRLWIGTLLHRYRPLGPNVHPRQSHCFGQYILAFWHENLVLPAYHFGHRKIYVLISQHADGELMAQICRHLGFGTIRGSTTRGGIEALRQMLRASRHGNVAVVPDGPRGPRRQVQLGLIYLASRTGLPIVAGGIGFHRPRRASSWDRFVLPRLWSRACTVTTKPILVPPDLDRDQLEHYRRKVEAIMHQVSELAERWAETGKWPGPASFGLTSGSSETGDAGVAA